MAATSEPRIIVASGDPPAEPEWLADTEPEPEPVAPTEQVHLLEAQVALRDERIRDLEQEVARARAAEAVAKSDLDVERTHKAERIPKVPVTVVQKNNALRKRRRQLTLFGTARLVNAAMRTDSRTKSELAKLSRPELIDLIIDAESGLIEAK